MFDDDKMFSDVLRDAMDDAGIVGNKRLETFLCDEGITDIDRKRIGEYLSGHTVPRYERAARLLRFFGIEPDTESLSALLVRSREKIKESGNGEMRNWGFNKTITIFFRKLLRGYTSEEAELILHQRIEELFGDESCFSAYVTNLIAKDLSEYLLKKDDIERNRELNG